ncbi:ZIP family metal transporter [Ideonella sp. A 288]|uniref:ZIP family metal transporter n=1 Tax=Ideonella sp. A 288 TaxID=1962181 RepID=UPI001303849B|nr:ZIP family metal transporter [Ideonella sp. A 288]
MIGLDVVLVACVLTNAAGLVAAAVVMHSQRARRAGPRLVSFAIGVLLGAVLLDLLPHLWEATGSVLSVMGLFAAALLASWLFDTACACSHRSVACNAVAQAPTNPHDLHHHHLVPEAVDAGRGAAVLLLGDLVHSVVDGALIVAALAVGAVPGAVATLAVAVHEVPRRVAIVTLLVRSGYRPAVALGLSVCAGVGTVLGGVLAWWSAEALRPALPAALALSAAALLYAALSQSAHLAGAWRTRVLTLEFGLPFLAGVLMIGGTHHLHELLG